MSKYFNPKKGERPSWTLTLTDEVFSKIHAHLFPGDDEEHAAIIKAGICRGKQGYRVLVREIVFARDGVDFIPSQKGYRMLTAEFITQHITRCRDEGLVYLAVHNHRGIDSVEFSTIDLASQKNGYPALLDIANGPPVGALVFAKNAVAGRLWFSRNDIHELTSARILGRQILNLFPAPPAPPPGAVRDYDRQSRIFGDRGQHLLSRMLVGVIGTGGVGSLVVEYLARLGVGNFIVVDPKRVDVTNLPRITGSTRLDAMAFFTKEGRPKLLRKIGHRLSSKKVMVMKRLIHRANPRAQVEALFSDIVNDSVARRFLECDYLFNAADTYQARLVFNALVHSFLIPGVDMGSKVPVGKETGMVGDVMVVVNQVTPLCGCLLCNGYIPPAGLQQEMETSVEKHYHRYIDDDNIFAPSVVTLNATAASHAVNDFLFSFSGLVDEDATGGYMRFLPKKNRILFESPRKDPFCPHCSSNFNSLFALGEKGVLPTRE